MLSRAVAETGQTEREGAALSPRAQDYLRAAGIAYDPMSPTPYLGGAFLAWLAIGDTVTPPVGCIDADAWLSWGHPLTEPQAGAVVVLTGGAGSARHLCGVVVRTQAQRAYVIGPHDGQIRVDVYRFERVIAARRPPHVGFAAPAPAVTPVHITLSAPDLARPAALQFHPVPAIIPSAPPAQNPPPVVVAPALPAHPVMGAAVVPVRSPMSPENLETLRRQAIMAIAAVAESHQTVVGDPDEWTRDLAKIAADVTIAVTRDGILAARDRAISYIGQYAA